MQAKADLRSALSHPPAGRTHRQLADPGPGISCGVSAVLSSHHTLLLLWLADGDRERDRETERPLGAEPDRDRDLLTGVLDLERAGEPDLLLRLEYDGDRRRLLLWLRLRERER